MFPTPIDQDNQSQLTKRTNPTQQLGHTIIVLTQPNIITTLTYLNPLGDTKFVIVKEDDCKEEHEAILSLWTMKSGSNRNEFKICTHCLMVLIWQ